MLATDTTVVSGLASTRSTYRLNQIDKVRANGIGNQVSLPQVAVFGDQSSGKSSILERTTGIPFPRQEGLCTRFPTEIILRHTTGPFCASASIHPSSHRSPEEKKTLHEYKRELSTMDELPSVVKDTATMLGIRGFVPTEGAPAFAHDILRIEIAGPIGLSLTIVDLPGLISVPDDDDADDVRLVTDLIESYLASSRTIIIAVVQASNDVANQRIMQLARKHDAQGVRTVGVITKPDLINAGAEAKIAKLARNEDTVKLQRGFFLLKNPVAQGNENRVSWDEATRQEREFFDRPVWQQLQLDKNRIGASTLQTFLQDLLETHIEEELPKVREEIKDRLSSVQAELSAMGTKRSTPSDIRRFLTDASMKFHRLVEAAMNGNYQTSDKEFFKSPDTRLRADVHRVNTQFSEKMRVSGQKRQITGSKQDRPAPPPGKPILVTSGEMSDWAKSVYENTRGRELPGNPNTVLLEELFHEQSSLWPLIATEHVQKVGRVAAQWVTKAMRTSIPDKVVYSKINGRCGVAIEKALARADKELDMLIAYEQGPLITYNHYYTDNVQNARRDKQNKAVREGVNAANAVIADKKKTPDVGVILTSIQTRLVVNMDAYACSEALDSLDAYYKVAMKTFVDNVCRQVIERHIMAMLPQLFNPSTASDYTDDELLHIGSEPESQKRRRTELQTLVKGLEQILVDLEGFPL